MSKIQKPTQDEVDRFSSIDANDEEIVRILTIWDRIHEKDVKFYLVVQQSDNNNFSLYTEPATEEWLDGGFARAFLTQEGALEYIEEIEEQEEHENPDGEFKVWGPNYSELCDILNEIVKQTGEGLRVILCKIRNNNVDQLDVLWDNKTT